MSVVSARSSTNASTIRQIARAVTANGTLDAPDLHSAESGQPMPFHMAHQSLLSEARSGVGRELITGFN